MYAKSNVWSTSGIIEKVSSNIFWETIEETSEYDICMLKVTCGAYLELLKKCQGICSRKPLKIL